MFNIISWNIWGLGNSKSYRRLRKLTKDHNINLIAIQEPMQAANKIVLFNKKIGMQNYVVNSEAERKLWLF